MDEVDKMIIETLGNLSVNIEHEKNSLSQLTTEQVVESVVNCINKIDPKQNLPTKLPTGMSARFNAGSQIAKACKSLGCGGDLGYQTFLYSNEQEIRSILIYLIEKLPKTDLPVEENNEKEEHDDFCNCNQCYPDDDIMLAVQLLPKETRNSAIEILNRKRKAREKALKEGRIDDLEEENVKVYTTSIVTEKEKKDDMKELAQDKIVLSMKDKFENKDQDPICTSKVSDYIEEEAIRKKEIKEAQEAEKSKDEDVKEKMKLEQEKKEQLRVKLLKQKIQFELEAAKKSALYKELRTTLMALVNQIKNMENDQVNIKKRITNAQEELEMYRKMVALVPEGKINIDRLQAIILKSTERLQSLKQQWAEHRNPHDQEFEDLQYKYKVAKASDKTLTNLYDQIAYLEKCLQVKEVQFKTLNEQAFHLKDGQSRETFTQKILEIVGSISKQQEGIDKIIQDVKSVQKDINLLNGRLGRAFFDTSRIMKQHAPNKDKNVNKMIEILSSIHGECQNTIEAVRKSGAYKRDIKELYGTIHLEKQKNLATKNEKLKNDLELIQNENREKTKKYRKLKGN